MSSASPFRRGASGFTVETPARPARSLERAARALVALTLLACAGCGHVEGAGSERLRVEGPRWWFSVVPVRLTAIPSGALAGRKMTLTVAVDLDVAGRWSSDGKPTSIWVSGSYFASGANVITVKTGSERTTVRVQIVSVVWLLAILAISGAIVVALVAAVRQRRAAAAPESVSSG